MSHAIVPASVIIIDAGWSILQGESNLLDICKMDGVNEIDIEVLMSTWHRTRDLLMPRLLTYVGMARSQVISLEVIPQNYIHVYLAIKY